MTYRHLPPAIVLLGVLALSSGAAPAEPSPGLRVAVISDLNGSYGSIGYGPEVHRAVRRIRSLRPDLVISTGDLVAGQRAGLDYRAMWSAFDATVLEPLASAGIPLLVSPGNHDGSALPRFAEERARFVEHWARRRPAVELVDGSDYPLRYSFAAGSAFFVALDATRVGPLDAAERAWLRRQLDLGAAYPLKIVFGHLPLHPFSEGRAHEVLGDPELEALLVERGVELFLSGHHHSYYPGRRGPMRLVGVGCLGSGPRRLLGETERAERSFVLLEIVDGRIASLEAYGGDDFARRIPRAGLPERIAWGDSLIVRDDLDAGSGRWSAVATAR